MWGCYVLMADIPLRLLGLSEVHGLGLLDAFALMAVGAIGMSLPSPGGAGSYHYATVLALTALFSVPASPAAAYAVIGHAAQLLFYCVAGVVAQSEARASQIGSGDRQSESSHLQLSEKPGDRSTVSV